MVKVKTIFGHFYNGVSREIGDTYEINESDFALMKQYSVFKEVTDSDIEDEVITKKRGRTKELK